MAEPFARAAAGILGGFAAAGRPGNPLKRAISQAPSPADFRKEVDRLHDVFKQADLRFENLDFAQMVSQLRRRLERDVFRESEVPQSLGVLKKLVDRVGRSVDFDDLDDIRKELGSIRTGSNAEERKVANRIAGTLDRFTEVGRITGGTQLGAVQEQMLKAAAKEIGRRNIKNRLVEEAIQRATTGHTGIEAGLRREFQRLDRINKRSQRFTMAEATAIRNVARGRMTTQALRTLGRFGFDSARLRSIGATINAANRTGSLVRLPENTQQRAVRETRANLETANARRGLVAHNSIHGQDF